MKDVAFIRLGLVRMQRNMVSGEKFGDDANSLEIPSCVCVIIAAMNAEATIAKAVTSALAQPEVAEVVVIDDASTDATADRAIAAAGDDPRLRVLKQPENIGPAAARNLAIEESQAPCIAVLDADDWLIRGRFQHMLVDDDWDLVADNIVFLPEGTEDVFTQQGEFAGLSRSEHLDLKRFVEGNLSQQGTQRGELGFLKPIISRAFLRRHDLCYDPGLRLGEDYDLYVRALMRGARFRLSHRVGYAARVRANSLSGAHRTADLNALLRAADAHVEAANVDLDARPAMLTLRRQLRDKFLLRAFLDRKSEVGLSAAVSFALTPPMNLPPIAIGVLSDKISAVLGGRPPDPVIRYLLPLEVGSEPPLSA